MLRKARDVVGFLASTYRRYRDEDNILVYQMGKVGSTSLAKALGERAIQIHNFYPGNDPCARKPFYRSGWRRKIVDRLFFYVIRRAVRARRKLKIVTLVRDPVGRNVSMYFQHLHYWLAYYFSEVRADRDGREGIDTLVDCFREAFDHRYPLEWFDRELKRFTGVDVYEHAFDRTKGCAEIKQGRVDVLIVQTEKLQDCWHAVEDFCGLELESREDNRAERKWYGALYSEFLNRYSLRAEELDEIYSSRFATFFFSEAARADFRCKWLRPK